MIIINGIKSLFAKKWGGTKLEHPIELAFECGGVKYFKFVNEFNIPSQRALVYVDMQAELTQKIDKKYLDEYFQAVITACNKGNLVDVAHLTRCAKQRQDNVTVLDSWYKIASVLYFDENENPYFYDFEYNEKKIENWKRNGRALSFFTQTHLKGLVTCLNFSEEDMQNYQRGQHLQFIQLLRYRLESLSDGKESNEEIQKLKSDLNTLEELTSSTG